MWARRRETIERVAPALAATEIGGVFAVAFLIEGPVKLDVFYERQNAIQFPHRIAVKRLWGPDDLYLQLKTTAAIGEAEAARALQYTILGFLQGGTWPVRLLARGQLRSFLYGEILLIETGIVPLMLLERDPRTFHRNMFTRAKMLDERDHRVYAALIDRITAAVQTGDGSAMRETHIEIFRELCRLSRAAFQRYQLEFPPRVEAEMISFYRREWPL